MTVIDQRPLAPQTGVSDAVVPYLQWGPIVAGAFSAAALAFVLHSFAAAIGLAVASTAPTWRDSSAALWLLSGLYLILAALAAYGLGGYVAGRARTRQGVALTGDELETRDGGHGLLAWALATLLTALLIAVSAPVISKLAAPPAAPVTSVGSENILAYDLDRLFRGDRHAGDATDLSYARSEAGRILLTTSGHDGILADDRTYLVRLVAGRTGLPLPDAERRTDAVIASAKANISRARRSTVILAFMAGTAALLGAAAAWFAACVGGRHRDNQAAPSLMWTVRGPRITSVRAPS
jgi:hypothetical protein